jgi:hypothetical protein
MPQWRGSIRQARVDGGGAAQGLTDGAPLGDLEQPQSLFFGAIAVEMNQAMKLVDRRGAVCAAAAFFRPRNFAVFRA